MSSDRKLHLIGNAHLDPVWLWRWPEGFAEIKATFRAALDRMNEFPEFIFTCACAAYYEWVERNAPEMFEEIARRVREGRWVIVGGWWIQPDCNLPCGESFARHGLLSQRYFLEKFGVMAHVGYNVDSFGHSGMLPQILRQSCMDSYVYQRPDEEEKDLPYNLFWWQSADGSRVAAFKLPFGYNHGYDGFDGDMDDMAGERNRFHDTLFLRRKFMGIRRLAELRGIDMMAFYGVGNHGGGPTARNLELIRALRGEWGGDMIAHSSPDDYFRNVLADGGYALPVVCDDLQHHARGCYSACSEMKAANRKAEHRLLTAEKLSSAAHALLGQAYPADELRRAWKLVLFNQFHDILGGCSIREAYDDAREQMGEALSLAAQAINDAAQRLSWAIDTLGGRAGNTGKTVDWRLWEAEGLGAPLVVFNPLPWPVMAPVQANRDVSGVTDDCGRALPLQKVRSSQTNVSDKWDTLFMAQLPAMGYRVFQLHTERAIDAACDGALEVDETHMENRLLRVEFDSETGMVSRLLDKRTGTELMSGCMAAIVFDETHCDTWAHGVDAFDRDAGRFGQARWKLVESGPLRARLRSVATFGQSELRMDYILYRHSAVVEIRVRLDWRERHMALKLSVPVCVNNAEVTSEIPFGSIARQPGGGEEPGQQWLDVSGTATGGVRCGLALFNDSKYGYSAVGSDMRLTLARSPIFADHFGERDDECEYMDQGPQEFRLALAPHSGGWQGSGIVRRAYELNVPIVQVPETHHRGVLPLSMEGIAIEPENVLATAFKRAEDGSGYVLRCHETDGLPAEAIIRMPLVGRQWQSAFGKNEIKTFYIPGDSYLAAEERNLLEF